MVSKGQFLLVSSQLLHDRYITAQPYISNNMLKPGYYNLHIAIDSLVLNAGGNFAVRCNGDFGFIHYFENTVLSYDP